MTKNQTTPMLEQYWEAKSKNPDALLFFRLGDFYELFFEDAKKVSAELNLTLTSRNGNGNTERTPMCGVPYHAAETYIEKLIQKGYKVAIAEQIGDPKAKGLTKREVIRVVTPGTQMFENSLTEAKNNYIALLKEADAEIALVCADLSTGECFWGIYEGENRVSRLLDSLYSLEASEILLSGEFTFLSEFEDFIRLKRPDTSVTNIIYEADTELLNNIPNEEIPASNLVKTSIALLFYYLKNTAGNFNNISHIEQIENGAYLQLDAYTLRNLEITKNLKDGGKAGTLYDILDLTKTPMGSRLLKHWLERPLKSVNKIDDRLSAVEEFYESYAMREDFFAAAKEIRDLERLLTRVAFGSARPREVLLIKNSLMSVPKIKNVLNGAKSQIIREANEKITDFSELAEEIENTVEEDAATNSKGNIIKTGISEELDKYRRMACDSKALLQEMEESEKEKTGIRTLKIGYNRVFGYYIEVRNSGKDLIPERYERKQTLANAERYVTPELKDFETKILGAEGKAAELEEAIFNDLLREIAKNTEKLQETAKGIAKIDVIASLAEVADKYNYARPRMSLNGEIIIKDGRHPLIERLLKNEIFVPNDTTLNHSDSELLLITGPNMAGKSTYMRQVALIALMAQAGSFVPAASALITPVDRIFTRIGASDDLSSGESTFMVEMKEVSHIIKNATKNSLVILDEIGRGTSTYDGMSIARAVVEYINEKIRAKTLFATHYHELTDMEGNRIKNLCVAVKEHGGEVAFLRRIIEGAADKSYGIHVGKLAGLPNSLIKRATAILKELESESKKDVSKKTVQKTDKTTENSVENLFASSVLEDLLKIDCMSMTPLEALNALFKLQENARKEMGR